MVDEYYKAAYLGIDKLEMHTQYFRKFTIEWTKPKLWEMGEPVPVPEHTGKGCVYAILRNHGKSKTKDDIAYIGLTQNFKARFANHPKADKLRDKKGDTQISIGVVHFIKGLHEASVKPSLEALEHLLIWILMPTENNKKTDKFPVAAGNNGKGWHIINKGYRFCGQMPQEIVYPWILVRAGRDRSTKK